MDRTDDICRPVFEAKPDGDGSALDSNATVIADGDGLFQVLGSHTYATAGDYPITVDLAQCWQAAKTVADVGGGKAIPKITVTGKPWDNESRQGILRSKGTNQDVNAKVTELANGGQSVLSFTGRRRFLGLDDDIVLFFAGLPYRNTTWDNTQTFAREVVAGKHLSLEYHPDYALGRMDIVAHDLGVGTHRFRLKAEILVSLTGGQRGDRVVGFLFGPDLLGQGKKGKAVVSSGMTTPQGTLEGIGLVLAHVLFPGGVKTGYAHGYPLLEVSTAKKEGKVVKEFDVEVLIKEKGKAIVIARFEPGFELRNPAPLGGRVVQGGQVRAAIIVLSHKKVR